MFPLFVDTFPYDYPFTVRHASHFTSPLTANCIHAPHSYWLFVFLLMTLATVVIVGLFEQCRMVLMVMWGVCTSLLVFAVDYTLTLNDQMSLMEDRAQVRYVLHLLCGASVELLNAGYVFGRVVARETNMCRQLRNGNQLLLLHTMP